MLSAPPNIQCKRGTHGPLACCIAAAPESSLHPSAAPPVIICQPVSAFGSRSSVRCRGSDYGKRAAWSATLIASKVITNVVPYIGELKAHGLGSWSTPVGIIENLTEYAAVTCNSSWILGIAAVTFGFRVLLLPIVFKGMRNNYTMANLRPEIQLHQERAKQLDAQGDEQGAMAAKMKVVEIFQKNGVNPFKAMLPAFVQMPLFISFFFGLKNMAAAPVRPSRHAESQVKITVSYRP